MSFLDPQNSIDNNTAPSLAGNLDVNGNSIVSNSGGNVAITPDGTGNVLLGTLPFDADQTVGAGQDNFVLTYDNSSGVISLETSAAGGNVSNTGTPVDNQVGVWTNATTMEGTTGLTYDGSTLDITGTLDASVEMLFTERADHNFTPEAGRGILWVRNDSPNALMFTDDAGTDYELTAAGSGASISGTPASNQIATWTDPTTITGTSTLLWDETDLILDGSGVDGQRIRNAQTTDSLSLIGGNAFGNGSDIVLYGGSHSSQANDMFLRSAGNWFLMWDESAGSLTLRTDGGTKTIALTLDASQNADFAGNVDVGTEVLFTERADHVFTPVTGRGILWLRNDSPNKLIFTDDAGTDHDLLAAGSGDVSKVGTPVNNQVGVWTGDGTIEGTSGFTYDSATLDITGTVDMSTEILFTERADHNFTPAATRGILWVRNDTPNALVYTDDAGTDHNLTAGSGAQISGTPVNNQLAVWTNGTTIEGESNLTWDGTTFAVGNHINASGNAEFGDGVNRSPSSGPTTANAHITIDGNGYDGFITLDGTSMHVGHNASLRNLELRTFNTTGLTVDGNQHVYIAGGMRLTERADHGLTPTAGFGELWLRNDSPNVLVFTDDTGVDTVLGSGGGGGDVTKVGTPVNNQLGVWTGDGTIEGTSSLTYDSSGDLFTMSADVRVTNSDGNLYVRDNNAVHPSGTPKIILEASGGEKARMGVSTGNIVELQSTFGGISFNPGDSSGAQTVEIEQGGLVFNERADHAATPGAAKGELWVRNDSPNALIFTDDAGTDHDLTASGSGDVSKVGTPANNEMGVWTGDGTIEGASDLTWDGSTFTIGADSVDATPGLDINSAAGNNPVIRFQQSNTNAAIVQFVHGFNELRIQTTGNDDISFWTDGAEQIYVSGQAADLGNLNMGTKDITFTEKADHNVTTPSAGQGYVWVRNDSPSALIFTDDAGNDYDLTASSVTIDGTPADNRLAVWTGASSIEGEANLTYASNVFSVLGADANFTLSGTGGGNPVFRTGNVQAQLSISAGTAAAFGANIQLYAQSHASLANDVQIRASGNAFFDWDESDGELTLSTGTGVKSTALTLDSSQNTLIEGGVRLTERADHGLTPAAGFGELWVRNDSPNALIFTDDAGTDHDLTAGGGGGNVSNTGTPVNNQLAIWTDATTIEGSSRVTFDGANTFNIGGGVSVAPTFELDGTTGANLVMRFQESGSNRVNLDYNDSTSTFMVETTLASSTIRLRADTSDTEFLDNGSMRHDGTIRFTERADHIETPAATFGELWVRDDAANSLMFTDDAGSDHKVAGGIDALADSATPSVAGGRAFITGGTTTITDFTGGHTGQEIIILSEHAITITDGTNIFLAGSTNFVMANTDSLHLIQKADGNWYEISRSVN